jgi:predicted transcriptional regulator
LSKPFPVAGEEFHRASLQLQSTDYVDNRYAMAKRSSTKIVDLITPAQCRAGRALLNINQGGLADQAALGLSTVVDFEKSRRDISEAAMRKIIEALQSAGVEFIEENGGGPGVRLRKARNT